MGFFNKPALKPLTKQEAEQAAKLLGLHSLENQTFDSVRAAFRTQLKKAHPDAGGDSEKAALRIRELADSRDKLLKWMEDLPDDSCPQCKGKGYVRTTSFGSVKPCNCVC